jgi:Cu2+-exporting ATPase
VEQKLQACEGVLSATVNLVTEVAVVQTSADLMVDPQVLSDRLTQSGFPTQLRGATEDATHSLAGLSDWLSRKQQENREQRQQLVVSLLLLALSTLGHLKHFIGFTIPILSALWFHGVLATLVLVLPARQILIEGWQGARQGAPNMNTLVALGAFSAYGASLVALLLPQLGWECFFDEPVMLLSFILLGRTLEQRARFRATDALRSLLALQPVKARLIPSPDAAGMNQTGIEIPVTAVQIGEWLQILPGETIPADGVVTWGKTTVNESMLTGESLPVEKQPGDSVVMGTLNQTGAIALQVSHIGKDTVLAQMIRLVEAAQARKAPIQRIADLVAGYFTYVVLTLAALTFAFWYLAGLHWWPQIMDSGLGMAHESHMAVVTASAVLVSLKRAIAVLVVACPCALGLATPTAILVGSGLGAERGLLVRGGDVLEALSRIDTIVFDKTGTLTTGHPVVTTCEVWEPSLTSTELLALAAAVEQGTQHPVAISIQAAANDQALERPRATEFETQPGLGVAATVTWRDRPQRFWLGNPAWLAQHNIDLPGKDCQPSDHTIVYVATADQVLGWIAVADTLRSDALKTVEVLQSQGLAIHILTGDRAPVAEAVAQSLNLSLDQVTAEVLPADKAAAIAALQAKGHRVALVGDGINDAPALTQADVGISLSSSTDIATSTADVVLMSDRLTGILEALMLGRQTVAKIRQNLAWAFAYNLIAIPAAAGVFLPYQGFALSPALAGGLMAFSSVTVVVNSLLLKCHPSFAE